MSITGSTLLIGGILVVGVVYLAYKKTNNKEQSKKVSNSLSTKEDRYKSDKNIIEEAIEEQNWKILEEMLNDKSTKDFPDLIKMVEDVLKNKNKQNEK